jgi:hypothetical protein
LSYAFAGAASLFILTKEGRFLKGADFLFNAWRKGWPIRLEELWVLRMKIILGWSIVLVVGAVAFVNALFMLASPRAWFRLPGWVRAQGTLTEQKYASGWGGVTVRIAGAIILAVIAWVLYDSLVRT